MRQARGSIGWRSHTGSSFSMHAMQPSCVQILASHAQDWKAPVAEAGLKGSSSPLARSAVTRARCWRTSSDATLIRRVWEAISRFSGGSGYLWASLRHSHTAPHQSVVSSMGAAAYGNPERAALPGLRTSLCTATLLLAGMHAAKLSQMRPQNLIQQCHVKVSRAHPARGRLRTARTRR